jgi:pimeloyl-ACP methyl ester carboxylesterase
MSQTGYAEVNQARLYYEVAGSGPAVTLLHFGLGDSRFWDDQFAVFAERYTVVRYDYRGFGKSSIPPGDYSQRADLDGLLQYLGIHTTAVIGVSMGGGLALDYTIEHPERVSALVPVAAAPSGYEPSREEQEEISQLFGPIQAAEQAGDLDLANDLEVRLWVDGPRRTPEQVPSAIREKVREMNGNLYRRLEEAKQGRPQPMNPPAAQRLGEIHVPTLVIIGDQDVPGLIRMAEFIAAGIPGARRVVMPDTAHAPNMERPAEFNHIVLSFLDAVAAG